MKGRKYAYLTICIIGLIAEIPWLYGTFVCLAAIQLAEEILEGK